MQIPKEPDKVHNLIHKPIRDRVSTANSFPLSVAITNNPDNQIEKVFVY
jgi:hypothetical protein